MPGDAVTEAAEALCAVWAEADGINPLSPIRELQAQRMVDALAERGWQLTRKEGQT